MINFYTNAESVIRATVESQNLPMRIELRQGKTIISSQSSTNPVSPSVYSISQSLKQHSSYTLVISHYGGNKNTCQTYALMIEIGPSASILTGNSNNCQTHMPGSEIITERFLENTGPILFGFNSPEGYSLLSNENEYEYLQSSKLLAHEVPFSIASDGAMITGHLQTDFLESGVSLQVIKDNEVLVWGRYDAAHRLEIPAFSLSKGDYSLLFKETTKSPVKSCAKFTASVIIEDLSLWDDIQSMIRKTETCSYIDQPGSLNVVGQLHSGSLHWHKQLELDILTGATLFDFSIVEESILRAFVVPQKDITFEINLMEAKDNSVETVEKVKIGDLTDGLHRKLKKGSYLLEISYYSDTALPSRRLCPSFELDLQIISMAEYEKLAEVFSCSQSAALPSVFKAKKGISELSLMHNSQPLDYSLPIDFDQDSEFEAIISFENALSGFISLELSDQNGIVGRSIGVENYSELIMDLAKGSYNLRIVSSHGKTLPTACWPLQISVITSDVKSENICSGEELPPSLSSKKTSSYGGPQAKDGSVSFHGTFKVYEETSSEIVKILAPKSGIARIMTISNNPKVLIESAVYSDSDFKDPVAYTRNRSNLGSYIFVLKAQKTPYYLMITYIKENLDDPCVTFDLKIAIETTEEVENILTCKAQSHDFDSLLPKSEIYFSKEKEMYGSDTFVIFDKWIIGDKNKLPTGVVSDAKENQSFIYEMTLHFPVRAIVSIESTYDYLTNDLSLTLSKDGESVSRGTWTVLTDDEAGELMNFSTLIDNQELDPGKYKLQIKQAVASNHLIQRFKDTDTCFPFSLNIEYLPIKDEPNNNQNMLVLADPGHLTHHNPNEDLMIFLVFHKPIGDPQDISKMITLESDRYEVLKPKSFAVSEAYPNKIKFKFLAEKLSQSTCYQLKLNENLSTSDGMKYLNDGIKHSYCTMGCVCNPKANAVCSKDLKCICPEPYTGITCNDCIPGYTSSDGLCTQDKLAEIPVISEIKLNVYSPIKKDQLLKLFVTFSSAPFNKDKKKISTLKNNKSIIDAIYFVNESNGKTMYANSAVPINQGFNKWKFEFDGEDISYGSAYRSIVDPNQLFDAEGTEFKVKTDLPTFQVEKKPSKNTDISKSNCSLHGSLLKGECYCDEGYSGETCDMCDKNYLRNDAGNCEKIKLPEVVNPQGPIEADSNAIITSISPEGRNIITQPLITVTIALSRQPYTKDGLLIDRLTNIDSISSAFVLLKQNSKKYIRPFEVASLDKKGLRWDVSFKAEELENDISYKFVQVKGVLYTENGKIFSAPVVIPPTFVVGISSLAEVNDCSQHGRNENSDCVCNKGYTGLKCEKCDMGYLQTLEGTCALSEINFNESLFEKQETPSIWGTIISAIVYLAIGFCVIYLIQKLRQGNSVPVPRYESVELAPREKPEDEEELDLRSTRFDNLRKKPNIFDD